MTRRALSAATEAAAAVTVATAQREVRPAVTDSRLKAVSRRLSRVTGFLLGGNGVRLLDAQ